MVFLELDSIMRAFGVDGEDLVNTESESFDVLHVAWDAW